MFAATIEKCMFICVQICQSTPSHVESSVPIARRKYTSRTTANTHGGSWKAKAAMAWSLRCIFICKGETMMTGRAMIAIPETMSESRGYDPSADVLLKRVVILPGLLTECSIEVPEPELLPCQEESYKKQCNTYDVYALTVDMVVSRWEFACETQCDDFCNQIHQHHNPSAFQHGPKGLLRRRDEPSKEEQDRELADCKGRYVEGRACKKRLSSKSTAVNA